ncbi:hypothetical protein JW899_03350 [Candidatus Uhrbacteria bacterium]|nr:hypothetical protein [Candidatus Uhrbacteria bacterium]
MTALTAFVCCLYSCNLGDEGNRNPDSVDLKTDESRLSCKDYEDDSCCWEDGNICKIPYTEPVHAYLGFESLSNGACTGSGFGEYQCTQFGKDFYADRLRHDWKNLRLDHGGAAVDRVSNGLQENGDRLFSFEPDDRELPRETDLITHAYFPKGKKEKEGYGHMAVAAGKIDTDSKIPIIEENVAISSGTDGKCLQRRLKVKQDDGAVTIECGFVNVDLWEYRGFIRHNLSGVYGDCGFHGINEDCRIDDRSSQSFRDAYIRIRNETGISLGWAFDNGGGPFVHEVRGLWMQDFVNGLNEPKFGIDGKTAIVYNPTQSEAFVLRGGFWGVYKCLKAADGGRMGGPEILGVPLENEHPATINDVCGENPNGISVDAFQRFENGCLWWRHNSESVHIHLFNGQIDETDMAECGVIAENNEPGPNSCMDECSPGEMACSWDGKPLLCGNPDPDHCYEWITMECAAGLVCQNGACIIDSGGDNPTNPICGDGLCSGGEDHSSCPYDCHGEETCVHSSRRCLDSRRQSVCYLDGTYGGTYWETVPCPDGTTCLDGRCREIETDDDIDPNTGGDGADTDEGTETDTEPGPDLPHTVQCRTTGTAFRVRLTGPILEMTVGDLEGDPLGLMAGSNTFGGWSTYDGPENGRPWSPWTGDDLITIDLPPGADEFNLAVTDGFGNAAWLDIETDMDPEMWRTVGECRIDGTLLVRTDGNDAGGDGQGDDAESDAGPGDGTGSETGNAGDQDTVPEPDSPTLVCDLRPNGLSVLVYGLSPETLIEIPEDPHAVMYGSGGLWEVPYGENDPRKSFPFLGWTVRHDLTLPSATRRFNLYVADRSDPKRNSWLDLDPNWGPEGIPWTVAGDCRLNGTAIDVIP